MERSSSALPGDPSKWRWTWFISPIKDKRSEYLSENGWYGGSGEIGRESETGSVMLRGPLRAGTGLTILYEADLSHRVLGKGYSLQQIETSRRG